MAVQKIEHRSPHRFLRLILTLAGVCSTLLPGGLQAEGTVSTNTEAAVRAAMVNGGLVKFECEGTIPLTAPLSIGRDTIFDATGRTIILSGEGTSRIFANEDSAVTLSLTNLIIANGATNLGAGLYNAGTVHIYQCTFQTNIAFQSGSNSFGGGIYNASSGVIHINGSKFFGNDAAGEDGVNGEKGKSSINGLLDGTDGTAATSAQGGAIYSLGTLRITNSLFEGNLAYGGYGGHGGNGITGSGGHVRGGNGGNGGAGGAANAGAVYSGGTMTVNASTFIYNGAYGRPGGNGGSGAASQSGSTGGRGGSAGASGTANGGAILNAGTAATFINCTLAYNDAWGSDGANGNKGGSAFGGTGGHGGAGSNGGAGSGAGVHNAGSSPNFQSVTLAFNKTYSGPGGSGGSGGTAAFGGTPGTNGVSGADAAIFGANLAMATTSPSILVNTLLAHTTNALGEPLPNMSGRITDNGSNLSTDESVFFSKTNSLFYPDLFLGELGYYGGPTPTIPPLPGSKAIDKGTVTGAPRVDQRGFARPTTGTDIGAFERLATDLASVANTQPATEIVYYSARLNGQVQSYAQPATNYFEWGTSTNYGNVTTPVIVTTNLATVSAVVQLQPGTTYHFRLVSQTMGTNFYGTNSSFITLQVNQTRITSIDISSGTNVVIDFLGQPNLTYGVETSPDLTAWDLSSTPVTTTNAASGFYRYTAPFSKTAAPLFYRVVKP